MDKKGIIALFGIIGIVSVIGGTIGAITALGLSFTTLPAWVIGGIIGASSFIVLAALVALVALVINYILYTEKSLDIDTIVLASGVNVTLAAAGVMLTAISGAIGIGLAAAITAVSPGIFATWSAMLAGAAIGAIGLAVGLFIAGSMIEKIGERFPSEEYSYILEESQTQPADPKLRDETPDSATHGWTRT